MANSVKKFVTLALVANIFAAVKSFVEAKIAAIKEYTLPKATGETLGGIILGPGLKAGKNEGQVEVDWQPANSYTDEKVSDAIADLIGGAPETYDTLKEISDYIENHGEVVTALNAAIGNKANSADVYSKTDADGKFMVAADYEEATAEEIAAAATEAFGTSEEEPAA